jgi:hypothetical protein
VSWAGHVKACEICGIQNYSMRTEDGSIIQVFLFISEFTK